MYITFSSNTFKYHKYKQITLEDLLNNKITISQIPTQKRELKNITLNIEEPKHKDISDLLSIPFPKTPSFQASEVAKHYETFYIPKKSGGMRRIDAPDEELKQYLRELKTFFETSLNILPNEAAHAYVKERSTVTAIKKHQENKSNWFLKLDMKNFFPAHNKEYILNTLKDIYPMALLIKNEEWKSRLSEALDYALLNNSLPQGTPLSPTLTNILMVPIDYEIQKLCWDLKKYVMYTRYADDLLISSPYEFDYKDVQAKISKILQKHKAPFKLNAEKTRYGSKSGSNWNLGIMLNKDNRMTIGNKRNQRFRAALFNAFMDYTHNKQWDVESKQVLLGEISYYKAIDPEYTNRTIKKYETQFNLKLKEVLSLKV